MNGNTRAWALLILVIIVLFISSAIFGLFFKNEPLGTVADWVGALSTFATFIVTGFTAYLAYQKYLKEETSTPSENQVIVFSTKQQTTELVATAKGLQLYLYDIRPGRRKGLLWTIPISKLTPIPEISVYPSKETSEWGLFDVGEHSEWYYSKKLFPKEKELHDTIKRLIENSKKLAKK